MVLLMLLTFLVSCQQSLEQRVARWEDFRSQLMRAAEAELERDPFQVGKGEGPFFCSLL